MEKKYELTDEIINVFEKKLYRIRALRDFSDIKVGDLGGFVESERNLSHNDNAWVSGNAKIYDNAKVSGNAKIYGNARIYDNATIYGNARIYDNAIADEQMRVNGNAKIINKSSLYSITGVGSRNDTTTFFKTETGISVICGCFSGTLDEFEKKVKKTHGNNEHAQIYNLAIKIAKIKIK